MTASVVDLTCELIRRASVTPADAGCQGLIAQRLEHAGMEARDLSVGEVSNLLISHGSGSPHFMFLGHTDVVPPGPAADWDSPPFEPVVRDGYLFGRGTADMKGSVAAMVVALETFLRDHADHPGTLSLLLTSDEEGPAEHGVRAVAPWLGELGMVPDYCLVGEPSSLERLGDNLRIGRRGSIHASLRITGVQGHTAYADPGDNPVHRAGSFIAALGALTFDDGDAHFPPTRLQISNIRAGTGAENVTPGELGLVFNIRNNPNSPSEAVRRVVEKLLEDTDPGAWALDWRVSGEPFVTEPGELVNAAIAACETELGLTPRLDTGGGTSDGRFIAPLGAQVVELGPVNASIHKVNEHISLEDLERLPGVYLAVLQRLSGR